MTTIYINNSPPIKNSLFTFYVSLLSQASISIFQANPTLAVGDVKVSQDDGAEANITTLPTVMAGTQKRLKVTLTAAEMNGNRIYIQFSDVAGAEWQDASFEIATESEYIVEGSLSITDVLRLLLSIMTGKASGGNTNTIRFRDLADTKDRVVETVDSSGNRTGVTLDGS